MNPPAHSWQNRLPELTELLRLIDQYPQLEVRTACEVESEGMRFPVHALMLGNPSPAAAALGFFGGVHGLERIGSRVLLSFLHSLLVRLEWDEELAQLLSKVRLVFMPLVNPAGMWKRSRCNPNGVDLMRNAPLSSQAPVPWLVGGHRISARLPWYRGEEGAQMEIETRAVCELVRQELHSRPFSMALDCHSGFGMKDRIWFPFACSREPLAHLAEVHSLERLFSASYPDHVYVFEPQSRQYLAHGDLWDHLYLEAAKEAGRTFLPFTLELGSWCWVRKNPMQLFSRMGLFNPLPRHRLKRTLRRHLIWLEFMLRAAGSAPRWLPLAEDRERHFQLASTRWYRPQAL